MTAQENLTFCPYRSEDEGDVLSLWETVFHKKMPQDLWKWKYLHTTYGYRIMLCKNREGKPVAMFSGTPFLTNCDGKTVEITHLMDNMSHPDYRGQGVFIRTIEAFLKEYAGPGKSVFLYGFPGKYHFDIGSKYELYRELFGGVTYLTGDIRKLGTAAGQVEGKILPIKNIDSALDHLWDRCKKDYPFAVIRNAEFLKWRFSAHPLYSYEILGYFDHADELRAYAVIRADNTGKAKLVDIFSESSEHTPENFIYSIVTELLSKGVETVETWLPSCHFLTEAMQKAGFVSLPEPLGFIPTGRTFDPSLSFEWGSENLFYTMADGDLF